MWTGEVFSHAARAADVLHIQRPLLVRHEPFAGLFGDRGTDFSSLEIIGFNLAAPCGVDNDSAPARHTS